MYHHFTGKHDLALAAIRRTAGELRAAAEAQLAAPGTAVERVTAYLRRERDVLRGCPVGRLTQDPDVMADPDLRAPVEETLTWLAGRLADVLAAGRTAGELAPALDPVATAATIVATLQGGYVLARAAGDAASFDRAVAGVLALLSAYATPATAGEPADAAPVSRTIVLDQELPAPLPTRRVEVRRIRIAPGHAAGLHVHNGPVFGSIEAGSAVYQIDGEPAAVLTPGDTFYEPAGVRIARFDAQDAGVRFLAYFPLTAGQSAELTFPD
jgi:AcrR family transcriptional regulator/quercetin dioxygenase-like cupin family protein